MCYYTPPQWGKRNPVVACIQRTSLSVCMCALMISNNNSFDPVLQLFSCKEKLKAEVTLKNEALTQTATSQQLLRMKSEVTKTSLLDSG